MIKRRVALALLGFAAAGFGFFNGISDLRTESTIEHFENQIRQSYKEHIGAVHGDEGLFYYSYFDERLSSLVETAQYLYLSKANCSAALFLSGLFMLFIAAIPSRRPLSTPNSN